jgi:hypothetical protein
MVVARLALPDFFRRKREVFKAGHVPQAS